ncbi:M3 family oligoendopeptidase [Campylobacter sp. VicNov18]|uniref:M3 family oligoendopeptidase n=1 Tax=Campylobacter bilis TaxID=2691918 RepID=UPI00130DC75C|nr:M3 family oligoendopeptidase [Campylobacter bilis]MPV63658.1 M3 family oligoendopeptidase [Campylobacter hepaticus]MBM0637159.1 M3 family oligoendopeptidase [Campylobacter bilis]MCC8277875.1 M3 family oligoendopeptidase [Campylobacter bilis]MCC8298806.1 M3 family oligoendopeptidase [Campylobacter bilis]MCC8300785.1 M3 family oligoendopeptidase [Campylobacter bilis]
MLEWDLSALFKNKEELQNFTQNQIQASLNFKKKYENKLHTLNAKDFSQALINYENLNQALGKIITYAYLLFAKNTQDGSFYAKYEEECKKIEENLLFFELEFCELDPQKSQEFLNFCKNYSFYLSNLIENKRYNLSKNEERIMLYLSNTGAQAFSRLFDEIMSALKIPFEGKKLSEEEILSKMYDQDRSVRKKAAKKFTKVLQKNIKLLSFIINMIKTERKNIGLLRGYENAEISRHISNQISQKSVDSLILSAQKHFDLVSKFYKRKKQILGYDELKDYDRYAPIGKEPNFDFQTSKDIVLKAFKAFSPQFYDIAKNAFDKGWIDVYPQENKQGGAFSHSATPDAHPFVLLNYTNKRRDLFTLAHELGHTIHQQLSYNVSYLNQNTPLTTAETASVFAEMLIFDFIKDKLKKEELLALYANKIEDIFATFYRQINFTCFERRLHAQENELSTEELNKIWMEESQKMFQDSIKLTKNYAFWWSYIPHFIHSPFYCYAYAYAQLLVLALYGLYKSGKCENFKELYIKMLSLGGSISPKELVQMFGFDIEDENFWEIGIKEIQKLVDEFMELKIC